ncbi:hypothetical protein GGS26DRAFT_142637 [Hypomontagnella submonticulosa]|nr:hypothetical protein GGS26DRAFT_142637 [Hypomontagnella submonticulosa]
MCNLLGFLHSKARSKARSKAVRKANPPKSIPVSHLMECPPEIILVLSDYLFEADEICLSLTCKALFSLLRNAKKMQIDKFTKQDILYRLERDVPGLFYCNYNNILIPFVYGQGPRCIDSDHLGIYNRYRNRDMRQPEIPLFGMGFPGSMFRLPFYQARLVTNYGRLGPGHGIPPSFLSYQFPGAVFPRKDPSYMKLPGDPFPYFRFLNGPPTEDNRLFLPFKGQKNEPQVYWKESWKAKLVGDELLLSGTHSRFHSGADSKILQNSLMSGKSFFICMHTDSTRGPDGQCGVDLPDIDKRSPKDSGYCGTGSCKFCLTDWDASIEWMGRTYGWRVTITTYHDLGSCYSPSDWKWQDMNSPAKDPTNRDKCGGAVRGMWLEG